MAEPIEAVVRSLQRMQKDISDLSRDMKLVTSGLGHLAERFDAAGPYITYTMGLHTQNRADVEAQARDIADLKRRVSALETGRG